MYPRLVQARTFCLCLLYTSLIVQKANSSNATLSMYFFDGKICNIPDRLSQGCAVKVPEETRSRMACVLSCLEENNCVGSSWTSDEACFKHYHCPAISSSCGTPEPDHVYTAKACDNGGAWVPSKGGCQCVDGWIGEACQKHPRNCRDLKANGYPEGIHRFLLDVDGTMTTLFPTNCYITDTDYVSTYVLLNEGNSDFNMTWDEFVNGVYVDEPEQKIWIGLRWWREMSLLGWNNFVSVLNISNSVFYYYDYFGFHLSGKDDGYSYTYSSSVDFGLADCFVSYQNTPFSTWDRDQDTSSGENCAAKRGSGWWFKDCDNICNFMGWGKPQWNNKTPNQKMFFPGSGVDTQYQNGLGTFMYLKDV